MDTAAVTLMVATWCDVLKILIDCERNSNKSHQVGGRWLMYEHGIVEEGHQAPKSFLVNQASFWQSKRELLKSTFWRTQGEHSAVSHFFCSNVPKATKVVRKGLIMPCSGLLVFWLLLRGSFWYISNYLAKTLFTIFWEKTPFLGVILLFLLQTLKTQLLNAVSFWLMASSKIKRSYFNCKSHFGKTQNCLECVVHYLFIVWRINMRQNNYSPLCCWIILGSSWYSVFKVS